MAKDHEWEARWQEGQQAIEKRRKEEEERRRQEEEQKKQQAQAYGNWCPYCKKIIPIINYDEEEHFHGSIGGGADFTTIWHIEAAKCDTCDYKKEIKRWKNKDLFEKFIDWIKSWFN